MIYPELTTFSERLKTVRKTLKLSVEQVAAKVKRSASAVRTWEARGAMPDALTLIKLAETLDVSSDYLLGLSNAALPVSDAALLGVIETVAETCKMFDEHARSERGADSDNTRYIYVRALADITTAMRDCVELAYDWTYMLPADTDGGPTFPRARDWADKELAAANSVSRFVDAARRLYFWELFEYDKPKRKPRKQKGRGKK
jgi:transcriptional regulator with XRE-family HTH domain